MYILVVFSTPAQHLKKRASSSALPLLLAISLNSCKHLSNFDFLSSILEALSEITETCRGGGTEEKSGGTGVLVQPAMRPVGGLFSTVSMGLGANLQTTSKTDT